MNDKTTTTDDESDTPTPVEVLRFLFPDERPISAMVLRGKLLSLIERIERLEAQVSELAARGE